ncbi:flavodoxin family protein [Sporomusa sp.]|uniref:flavodoxin family protein n=1 Tax=Sporomusa sp. TaxID=2078658 RepID=UPI002CA24F49|nr:flavodoxin family protein [Sporomusa sp.]HWR42233.1 flavodoxin family protein [Sporomusa sp.]
MKILGLVASPRRAGNSELLVKEMLASLPADNQKEMIRLTDLNIKMCKACYACLPAGKKCNIEDDLDFLLDRIRAADALIIASPCYFLGPHTSIKTIGDRLISVMGDSHEFNGKKCVTVVTYGINSWEGYAREAVNNFARFLHLDVVGDLLVHAAIPGEALDEDIKTAAHELVKRLIAPPGGDKSSSGGLTCADCDSSLLQISASGHVRCVMCGTTGQLQCESGQFSIHYTNKILPRFSPEGMTEHGRTLESYKERYISKRRELAQLCKPYSDYDWWVYPNNQQ